MPSFSLKTILLNWYRACIQCPPSRCHISTWCKPLCTSGEVLWAIHTFKITSHPPGPSRRGLPAKRQPPQWVTTACCHSTATPMQQCWGAPCPVPELSSMHSPSSWTSQFLPACSIQCYFLCLMFQICVKFRKKKSWSVPVIPLGFQNKICSSAVWHRLPQMEDRYLSTMV